MPFLALKCSASHSSSFGAYLVKICAMQVMHNAIHLYGIILCTILLVSIYFCMHSQRERIIVPVSEEIYK